MFWDQESTKENQTAAAGKATCNPVYFKVEPKERLFVCHLPVWTDGWSSSVVQFVLEAAAGQGETCWDSTGAYWESGGQSDWEMEL